MYLDVVAQIMQEFQYEMFLFDSKQAFYSLPSSAVIEEIRTDYR